WHAIEEARFDLADGGQHIGQVAGIWHQRQRTPVHEPEPLKTDVCVHMEKWQRGEDDVIAFQYGLHPGFHLETGQHLSSMLPECALGRASRAAAHQQNGSIIWRDRYTLGFLVFVSSQQPHKIVIGWSQPDTVAGFLLAREGEEKTQDGREMLFDVGGDD